MNKTSLLAFILLIVTSATAFAQQTYLLHQSARVLDFPTIGINNQFDGNSTYFVGCVEYKVTYSGLSTDVPEQQEKLDFLIENSSSSYGLKRRHCFNEHGDWLHIYGDGKHVSKNWYFADTNEEYILFANGVLKYLINDKVSFQELKIARLETTGNKKSILGYDLQQVILERESGTIVEYWVTSQLLRDPKSYIKNKAAYSDVVLSKVKGVHLHKRSIVAGMFVTDEEAINIDEDVSLSELFILPNVALYKME